MSAQPASFLTIPSELRNAIYCYVFTPHHEDTITSYKEEHPDPIAEALNLECPLELRLCHPHQLCLLQTCKQVHNEAHLLALSMTGFHITGERSYPDCFAARAGVLRDAKVSALRHITLTSRIASLRALNETWEGLPFGNPALDLETLTIVPTRADSSRSAYQEVADLSMSHTLAYIFAETLKGLRNVKMVQVQNRGCFNEVVWKLVYRSLVYRTWRWGGGRCGLRFQCSEDDLNGDEWFKVWLKDGVEGREVGDEVVRLVGASGELPDPDLFNI